MEIIEAGYDFWHNSPKLELDVLLGGVLVEIIGGNDFIFTNNGRYYEINIDESAGDITIVDITELQKM